MPKRSRRSARVRGWDARGHQNASRPSAACLPRCARCRAAATPANLHRSQPGAGPALVADVSLGAELERKQSEGEAREAAAAPSPPPAPPPLWPRQPPPPGPSPTAWYFFYFSAGVCLLPYINLIVFRAHGLSDQQIGVLGALKVRGAAAAAAACFLTRAKRPGREKGRARASQMASSRAAVGAPTLQAAWPAHAILASLRLRTLCPLLPPHRPRPAAMGVGARIFCLVRPGRRAARAQVSPGARGRRLSSGPATAAQPAPAARPACGLRRAGSHRPMCGVAPAAPAVPRAPLAPTGLSARTVCPASPAPSRAPPPRPLYALGPSS
jgi:hypothetical protein